MVGAYRKAGTVNVIPVGLKEKSVDNLSVLKTSAFCDKEADYLAGLLGCQVIHSVTPDKITETSVVLMKDDNGILQLQKTGKTKLGPIFVNFDSKELNYRNKHGGGKKQSLAKAVGAQDTSKQLSILDATAGLGTDAFVLASIGYKVDLLERCGVIWLLLEDGIKRARVNKNIDFSDRINLLQPASSPAFIKLLSAENKKYDVIYLDPMFPAQNKNIASKKEMQYLQDIVFDNDSDDLLEPAIEKAIYRVVVKRPVRANFLANKIPSYQLSGKSCRFDIYVNKSLKK